MKSLMAKMHEFVRHLYYRVRTTWLIWFYILNRGSRKCFEREKPKLDLVQKRIVDELDESGISKTSLEELFPEDNTLSRLKDYANLLDKGSESATKKKYLQDFWDPLQKLDLKNPFVRLALEKRVLDITNSYMGMCSKIRYFTLQRTTPVAKNTSPIQSQRWHRDPQEKRVCKIFIYLSDVDENSGPFIYIPFSTYGKKYGRLFPQKTPHGSYPPTEEVEKVIPKELIKAQTGKAGSVIFCDTIGLHRGGYATQRERIMFTALFAAPTYKERPNPWFKLPTRDELATLNKTARYALTYSIRR
jgi:hypothetical protein